MAIPNMADKVSSSDLNKMRDRHNPPENDSYFDDGDNYDEEDDMFADTDDLTSSNTTSGLTGGANQVGNSPFGSSPFGSSPFGNSPFGTTTQSPFGSTFSQPQHQQQVEKKDWWDTAIEFGVSGFKELWQLTKEAFATFKLKTVDDWALYSTHNILTGFAVIFVGILLWIIGFAYETKVLSFWNLPAMAISVGLLIGGYGLVGIGIATIYALRLRGIIDSSIEEMSNLPTEMTTTQEEYEEKTAQVFEDLFDLDCMEDDEDDYEDEEENFLGIEEDEEDDEEPEPKQEEEDINKPIVKISESLTAVPSVTREVLLNNLLPLFPFITPEFNKKEEVDPDSDEYLAVEALAIKALANAINKSEEEIESGLERLVKNSYSMELKIKRIRGLNKLDTITREIIAYFRNSVNDNSVQCTTDIDGDFYRIVVSFGNSNIVGLRDVLALPDVGAYYKDRSHALPFVACLDSLGNPVVLDAKTIDTMLIAGKPRSGKSWYLLSVILSLIAFNPPEEVQFLIIDPKESNLFKEVALLPHVCGLHNDSNVIEILKDVITYEGARRKKLLSDNRCENVWDLRKKGIILPILYIVIDEVMTIKGNLAENFKEFLSVISTIVTQLPSQGIRLMMVPHRSKGVIDPSIRTNISFTAAVRADTEIVMETLDIKKWDRPLLQPGELALKVTGIPNAQFGRSLAITSSDFDNSELIRELAKSFYKMGVDIPDMSGLGKAYNQDIKSIQEELSLSATGNRVQFSIDELQKADMEIDLNKY